MTDVAGRTVLVTGAASGLGRLMALRFARLGGRLVLWDLDHAGTARVAAELEAQTGVPARADGVDVTDRHDVYATAAEVLAEHGPVHVVVNSAGIMHGGLVSEHPDEVIEATLRVNTLGVIWVTKAFLPPMIERNEGHIVTMGSAAGVMGVARLSAYAASKHAVIGFKESLRAELRQVAPNVRTTVVNPYYVNTGLAEGAQTRIPALLPILEQERVADRVVRAVRRDEHAVSLPFMVKAAPWIQLLPVRVVDRLADWFGVHDSMRAFVGRHGRREDRPAV